MAEANTTTTVAPMATTTTTGRPAAKPTSVADPRAGVATYPLGWAPSQATVVFPYESGRAVWSGVSNGVTVKVSIAPANPRAGDVVRFQVEADAGDLPCCGLSIVYGDGSVTEPYTLYRQGVCTEPPPGAASADFTHVYNQPGRWEFSFQAGTESCKEVPPPTYGDLRGWVAVGPGTPTPQGPARPKVILAEAREPSQPVVPGALEVHVDGTDEDGFVTRIVIDWGDGSPPVVLPGDPLGCRPTASGWPASSRGWTLAPYPSHQYAARGSYTITAAVISAGCDGTGEQATHASMPYIW